MVKMKPWRHNTPFNYRRRTSSAANTYSYVLMLMILVLLVGFAHGINPVSSLNQETNSDLAKNITWKPMVNYQNREAERLFRRQLQSINKQPLKSIQSSDGDIIDCVPLDKQPAFDHPRLRDHEIQSFPSSFPTAGSSRPPKHRIRRPIVVPQVWHHDGSCPLGTIPVRRTSKEDLRRWATSPGRSYGRKTHKPPRSPAAASDDPTTNISEDEDVGSGTSNHEHAIAFVEGSELYGASAVLSVWDPWVETSNEFSLSQLWILGGSFDEDLNSIEAGWQVSPELYGDGKARLFIYWTTDGYQTTGCYNLLCSGFVQTSDTVAIGASIAPVSTFGGSQFQIEIMIWKDPRQGNWWMAFEGSHIVGYWPAVLFSHLSDHASMVEWGGEVVNSRPNGQHTGTQMGSGRFAEDGFGEASFFHSLQVVDSFNNLEPISNVQTLAENPNCYDIKSMQDPNWGSSFYYGGPGHNALCT